MAELSTFIRQNNRPILSEWEAFARTLTRGSTMDDADLRDHAEAILDDIAAQVEAAQTRREPSDPFSIPQRHGLSSRHVCAAAIEHGHARAGSGFTVVDMIAEFSALRANVTRLWIAESQQLGRAELDTLIRFNDAIDRAIADSLERYARDMDEARQRFLAILSHDLRNPLTAVSAAAGFLAEMAELDDEDAKLVGMIQNATRRMTHLVADMLEVALHQFGDTMPIERGGMHVGDLVTAVVAELRASYPKASIVVSSRGDLGGNWDSERLAQALTNLIGNAVQHGDVNRPIRVSARGEQSEVRIEVRNSGRTIPREQLRRISTGARPGMRTSGDRRHLGLGLFIVNKIIDAHGGSIEVNSTNAETAFTIHLPRSA
jgi:signal transduction histidine kinase